MSKRPNAELSPAFLTANREQLDLIGTWTLSSDPFNLEITWRRPNSLEGAWIPLNLRFRMDSGIAVTALDPDEPMFQLWEVFLSQRDEFLNQVRNTVTEFEEEWGPATVGRVEVYRGGGTGLGSEEHYGLQVYVRFEEDDEHAFSCEYNPDTGRFADLQG